MGDGAPAEPCFRRVIAIACPDARSATAWVEDDFHHFGVRIQHDGSHVIDVSTVTRRAPWNSCAAAGAQLRPLIGQALVARATDIGGLVDMRRQCTHMFDIAGLAVAAAVVGRPHRTYEVKVTDRVPTPLAARPHTGRCVATLRRDDIELLRWSIDGQMITAPGPARSLLVGFRGWTETLPIDTAEAATVLRRAIGVSGGRGVDLDGVTFAHEIGLPAVCHSYRPENARAARRIPGTTRDFSAGRAGMLAGDAAFLVPPIAEGNFAWHVWW